MSYNQTRIPSNIGIHGNEKADNLAKSGLTKDNIIEVKHSLVESKEKIKAETLKKWQNEWDYMQSWPKNLKPQLKYWASTSQPNRSACYPTFVHLFNGTSQSNRSVRKPTFVCLCLGQICSPMP